MLPWLSPDKKFGRAMYRSCHWSNSPGLLTICRNTLFHFTLIRRQVNDALNYSAEVDWKIRYCTVSNSFSKTSLFLFIVPGSKIQVNGISSSSLLVNWTTKWQRLWPRELRKIQIIYNTPENETAQNITVNPLTKFVELRGLLPFTKYCVRVQIVTHEGAGKPSTCALGKTQQSGR